MSQNKNNTSEKVIQAELNASSDSDRDSESDGAVDVSHEHDDVSKLADADIQNMSLKKLREITEKMSRQCDTIKRKLWIREAAEKTKRKRVFTMPARKKFKIDSKLKKNQETKVQYEELCRATDQASEKAKALFDKQLEQDQKITALRAERNHAQAMIEAWNNRSKSVRAQIAMLRSNVKQTQHSARKARKIAAMKVGHYNKVRKTLKHTLALVQSKSQLARKEAELKKMKKLQKVNEEKLKEITSSQAIEA
jgi:hypothetical protein